MLVYSAKGRVLKIAATGAQAEAERQAMYDDIAQDPSVALGSVVLLDVRRADEPADVDDILHRASTLVTKLGEKLGPACAVVVSPRLEQAGHQFKEASRDLGLTVELFHDELEAMTWLATFE
jgi:hypothetical protein